MSLARHWRAFIESLNSRGVEYLIVGAVALAHHDFPRHTATTLDYKTCLHEPSGNSPCPCRCVPG